MIPLEVLQSLKTLTLTQKQELVELLVSEIKHKQTLRQEQQSQSPRQVLAQQHRDNTTYQLELVACGNPRLKKVVSRYVGKELPKDATP